MTGRVSIWLRVDGAKGRTLACDRTERHEGGGVLVGTVDWRDRSIVPDVPADAQAIHFGVFVRGGGSAWARQFRFTEVDASVPLTDHVAPRRADPTNLDFAAVA